jgi:hypothetical protein
MTKPIFFLLKIFEKKEYAEDFIKGRLFLNRVSYFKAIENNDDKRGDEYEAVYAWLQPNKTKISIGDIEIKSEDIVSPIVIQSQYHDNLHLLCLYASYTDKFQNVSKNNVEEFRKEIKINERCISLGNYAVLILNTQLFFKRFINATKKYNYRVKGQLVKYYDPTTFHGFIKKDTIFQKQIEYSYQKEFRFAIDTGTKGTNPIMMEIGDLSDIASISSPQEINEMLEIRIK